MRDAAGCTQRERRRRRRNVEPPPLEAPPQTLKKVQKFHHLHQKDDLAEWLRRCPAKALCSARGGSNPPVVATFCLGFDLSACPSVVANALNALTWLLPMERAAYNNCKPFPAESLLAGLPSSLQESGKQNFHLDAALVADKL